MRSLRLRWRLLAFLAFLTLIAFACSRDGSQESSTTITAAQEVTATTAAPSTTATTTTSTTTTLPERFEGQLEGLTVIDENTFTVALVEPDPEFPLRLASPLWFALPDSALADPDAQNEQPVGNGPFVMEGPWEHDVRIRVVRNRDYRGPDPPRIDAIEWVLYLSPEAAYHDTMTGDLDLMTGVPPEFLATAGDDFGDRHGASSPQAIHYLGIPMYLDQYTVDHRRALSMAIDRERLVEETRPGDSPAYAVVPPALGRRVHVCDYWDYDPQQARDIWEAAGGLDEITLSFNEGSGHEEWIQGVVAMWTETLGLEPDTVTLRPLPFAELNEELAYGEAIGPFRFGWGQDYPSPLNYLEPLFVTLGTNVTRYDNPEMEEALAAGLAKIAESGDLMAGLPDYGVAEDIVCDDVPLIPVFFPAGVFVHSDNVTEVYVDRNNQIGYTVVESETGTMRSYLGEPYSLITYLGNESEGDAVKSAVHTGLVKYDPRTHQPLNAHAESITTDDGGRTWTIVLKPGWTFHDGTANDAASYVKAWSHAATLWDAWSNIVGAEELSSATGS